jgi:hypothetical protein
LSRLYSLSYSSINPTISRFYSCFNSWKVKWTLINNKDLKAEGVFNFIPFEKILSDAWDKDFGGNDWAPEMLKFRPLDMFYDVDGIVVFFVGRVDMKGLFLFSDSELHSIHIKFMDI